MFKVKHGLVSEAFESKFVINDNFTKLRSKLDFCVPKSILNTFWKNSRYLGPVMWTLFLGSIATLYDFKESIKK